ncbi:MAG: methionine biosynthesis PLP-dependent protein [Candidatus Margulisiibacteriota bacterium]|nr:MAG: cystathionine gamma-synthase [Candidatus Margulisbacteria bacterium GWD2_39_127]OGI05008.1 MAG: cystathionine gamma-synthase [Candidatus Margulisbacteria bacterium GWF2_38_17]PZM79608.1 MAG: methionine biosynthesis PLP-dependent protein [Candidatus Margulisiibacteriota bacterium]HAR63210.1 methionine biosynthesis PLP-dependent protein [Candidatus Margulisiibacteriota bacterium]HCY37286.1 methionine biosynthesis PLP-dependent protein [Candidatus Margulisiibacteriota bacterium]
MDFDTLILHNGNEIDEQTGAMSIPIQTASTYRQKDIDCKQDYYYSRSENPTRSALEKTMAILEKGKNAFAFSSGMAAVSAALLALLKTNDHIILSRDIYGGTYRLITEFLTKYGISHSFVDTCNLQEIKNAIRQETKVLFLESPSNPLLRIVDLVGAAKIAQENNLITMIDNTFMSPYLLNPLDYGINISIHSATKFLGGHSDLIAGIVVTDCTQLGEKVYFVQNSLGAVLGPQDCWLLLRGIKTLSARMTIQERSATVIAQWLQTQPWVKEVYYPGLASHPGHDILKAQARGFGAVVSFKTTTEQIAQDIMKKAKLWTVAVSLGGVESILSYPCRMSHASIPPEQRRKLGITNDLIRLSVGLENKDDLIKDLTN